MVTIVVSIFNRPNYTVKSIESLHKVIKNRVEVVFVDDFSTPQNTAAIKDFINQTGMTNYKYYVNEIRLGIERGVFFFPMYVDTPYVYISDNDVIYSSMFYEKLKESVKYMSSHSNPNMAITLFDTPAHSPVGEFEGYNLKHTVGGVSLLVKKDVFNKALTFTVRNGYCDSRKTSWDYGVSKYFEVNHGKLLVTNESYVQHIGEEGLHSRKSIPSSFVQAGNFIK